MKFRVICQKTSSGAHSPIQVVEQSTGKGVAWINRDLDREYVRRLANQSLFTYAHNGLSTQFIRSAIAERIPVSIHRQSRWLYGCWPLKGA